MSIAGFDRDKQRGIDKNDLQTSMKYGKQERSFGDTVKYTYNDIVYIYNCKEKTAVTCWTNPLPLVKVPHVCLREQEHQDGLDIIRTNKSAWKSNTVIVVDTSGSMRTSDVWGARNRLCAAWMSVALDYVAHRLETGIGCNTDVTSIVTMGKSPTVIYEELPLSWKMYNKMVRTYQSNSVVALGHGCFISALEKAAELLHRTTSSACACTLVFLSDGRLSKQRSLGNIELPRGNCFDSWKNCEQIWSSINIHCGWYWLQE